MKQQVFVILLLTSCFLKPAALSLAHDELAAAQVVAMCGLMRVLLDAPERRVSLPVRVPEQPVINRVPAHNNVQIKWPKQKRYYHYQNNKNNNRSDRQCHAHINMRVQQPKQRNQKRLVKSYQRS